MLHLKRIKPVAASLFLLLFSLPVAVAKEKEKEIAISEIPPKVLEAVRQEVPDLEILRAEIEREWLKTVFEINGVSPGDGFYYELEVTRRGKVLEIEKSTEPEEEEDDDEEDDD